MARSTDGRGRQRLRRAALTGVATLAARGTTIAASFISLPLTARYLGAERFGLWLTLSTLLTWVSLADLGLANSLTNALATADGQDDLQQAKEAISSTFWLTVGIASVLGIGFAIVQPWIAWNRVFNVASEQARLETGLAAQAGFLFVMLRLPLSIPSRIYSGYQEGYFYQMWTGLSSILSLIALLIGIHLRVNLPELVIAFFGTLLLADVLSGLHLFGWRRPFLRPGIQNFRWPKAKELLKTGIQFWVVQVAAIACFQTDLIIVAQLFGASAVASYGVVLKLFSLVGTVQMAFLLPLWAAYSEALAKRDIAWIIQTFKHSIKLSLIWSTIAGIALCCSAGWLVTQWVGVEAAPHLDLIIAMLVLSVLTSVGQCIAMVLNGLSKLGSQVTFGIAAAVTNLILSIVLGRSLGVVGVTWATNICLIVFSITIIGTGTIKHLLLLQKDNQNSNFSL